MTDLNFDLEPEFHLLYERCSAETMTSIERMYGLWQAVNYIVDAGIDGDLVECGVWRGGSMMLAALQLIERKQTDRQLWLYDTFEGMTAPDDRDVQALSGKAASSILAEAEKTAENPFWALASREIVYGNMKTTAYPQDKLIFVEGAVEETLSQQVPEKISILRLDTDWYTSTMAELQAMWPRLMPGGVLIVDDYGYWEGARQAVDEFFAQNDEAPLLTRLDFTGRMAVKR